jgi:hypothetical protein
LIAVIGEKQRDLRLDQLFTDGGPDTTAAANNKREALRICVAIVTHDDLYPPYCYRIDPTVYARLAGKKNPPVGGFY